MVFDYGGQIMAWALAATWPIMEAMRMVLASIWRDRIRRQAREEGIAIGEERSNQRWREWVQRRDHAEARGEPFNEPMPDDTVEGDCLVAVSEPCHDTPKRAVKWSVRKAGKAGYKAGRGFVEERAGAPAAVTDSLENLLDELAPVEPHNGLDSVDGNLVIVTINKRDKFK